MGYDIIADIHGQADKLEALLRKLDYRDIAGAWRHADRQAIFVGDFIDRGPAQVRSVQIVRRMVDAGAALAVMGNHELNAIAWHTPDPRRPGQYLRSHDSPTWGAKNRKQHAAFLDEVESKPALHYEIVEWFLTLPLWLDLPALHVVHACWHPVFMAWLAPRLERGRYLTRELMIPATDEPEGTLAAAFWCMNGGLVLMVGLSLLPIGIAQAVASVQTGLWYARSAEFLQQPWLEQLRWLRLVGDTVFLIGVGAFAWFMVGLWSGWSYEPAPKPRVARVPLPKPVPTR